ncbi:MAG: hypothetical protein J0H66_11665 [Solirubrobacterales bacterium]|nr:hypothetical protein [Solirubrobacterales bacterium]OJU94776.1 MAG: hypothetical protein BGO23_07930 [Solirubrobacterales bacterium 67-14]
MSTEPESVRSYQRVFRPDRRIYSIDGHPLPVPGGVPLRWLGYAVATLIAAIVIPAATATVALLGGIAAAVIGLAVGGRATALGAAVVAFVGVEIVGFVVGMLDWPLRLVVLPAAIATLANQKTPDGRSAESFAFSWIALHLAPRRRSVGRALPPAGRGITVRGETWISSDEHSPKLRRARVTGPALVTFGVPVEEIRRRRGRRVVRRLGWHRRRGGVTSSVTLAAGEVLEVRP